MRDHLNITPTEINPEGIKNWQTPTIEVISRDIIRQGYNPGSEGQVIGTILYAS